MISYAGIGSRTITKQETLDIYDIADFLRKRYVLYSGNADGADIAFQRGSCGGCVLWLPWKNFNKDKYWEPALNRIAYQTDLAKESVDKYHPAPYNLSDGARKMMARNYHQIMGLKNLYPVVSFVICCADYDENDVKGGTGQAVRIAKKREIPVYNLRELGKGKILEEVKKCK